jgi:thiol:disulfide interchange protein
VGAWIYGAFAGPTHDRVVRIGATLAALILLGFAVGLGFAFRNAASGNAGSDVQPRESGHWRAWSPEAVADLRAKGRPVFVNFTADWCLSCKVNEALVFQSDELWEKMKAAGITALKADWTRRDAEIARALESYGRAGVPLYIMYDRTGQARILSETLTPGEINAEIERILQQSQPQVRPSSNLPE